MPDTVAKLQVPADPGRAARAAKTTLASSIVVLAILMAANFVVDPRGVFPAAVYRPLRFDYYEANLAAVDSLAGRPDIAVLGSSTSLQLHPEAFGNRTAINVGAAQSSLEDAADVLAYMVRQGKAPRDAIVLVDDFAILQVDYNQPILPDSQAAWRIAGKGPSATQVGSELVRSLDYRYVEDSARVLYYSHVSGYPPPVPWQTLHAVTPDKIPSPNDPFMKTFETEGHVDAAKVEAIGRIAALAGTEGMNVTFLLPPIFPKALGILEAGPSFNDVDAARRHLLATLCGPHVKTLDLMHVESFAGDPLGFWDSHHFNDANGARMAAAFLAKVPPASC